ncbi:nicotinate-nucleotide adenylyltransferase [Blastopirellula marina]|uniref:Nicotinate-nucleotide adenylyltransferase n=1 Tax=Blastopirellula marina TaxID=124 RepID=A0A2S8G6J7_9BACT|nr:nicotinate-nucleotide adenylyltransferase [Blastopirellula marina]PQO40076.1 nicotinate-nucleotide adenylyltransferase [Blastopirellula marina]PQO43634.1 nicotinate-nucleotide adenylyltransferase [Blastopirellula marina]PTL45451.1 nicotinate-nucleotide adenylyltransferase [Blastopirellula marina]
MLESSAIKTMETRQKALSVNLDPRRYGTFAEIGAGQEVVRWFFRVGAGAGTIAKSMSAYDMQVSDAIYGRASRYVCRERLQAMLDQEHALNLERLTEARGETSTFFAFADTVAARGYKGNSDCHGWMGIKFQAHPRDEDSQIIIHVKMLDTETALQQEALGIVGVNLVYGAFAFNHEPELLVDSLLDGLSTSRIEIDMIEFSGIAFRRVDNRLMSLKLVELGLSGAAMFAANGTVLQPSEFLYRKPILVERGSFRPVCNVNVDMLRCAHEKFSELPDVKGKEVAQVMEITMRNLKAQGEIDRRDFLARADVMASCGMNVLISDYFEYFRLGAYLSQCTKEKIAITMGAASLKELFNEKYYTELPGGILESFGRLFKNDLKIYCYPYLDPKTGELSTGDNLDVKPDLQPLYSYLLGRGGINNLDNYNEECLGIFSRDVLRKIGECDPSWESMVPAPVARVIKERKFFDYQCPDNDICAVPSK